MSVLSLDFETCSVANLKRVGAYGYAADLSTQVICLAWALGDANASIWRPGMPFPPLVRDHVAAGGTVSGWNVVFEWLIWNAVLPRFLEPGDGIPVLKASQLYDTMAAAAHAGLPLSLDAATRALKLPIPKDMDGHRLMLRMSRPRGYDADGAPIWWHQTDAAKVERLCTYCIGDVDAERTVGFCVPPLPAQEQRYWHLDMAMNAHGVPLDTELVRKLKALALEASRRADIDMDALTGGEVRRVTHVGPLQQWLNAHGYPHDNIQKLTVAERLEDEDCGGPEREALLLRADTAKTSAAKLDAMLQTVGNKTGVQYVHGMLQFYGAIRTGRWAGRLIQMQNLPRGTVKLIGRLISLIERDTDYELIEAFGGPVLDVVSSALRGCIAARPGRSLICADFSQIEARVLAWLADEEELLGVFARGEDPYLYTANKQGSDNRTFGKVLVLALGYGMGAPRFKETAKLYGVILTDDEAAIAVYNWREDRWRTRELWWATDAAVKQAIRNPGSVTHAGKLAFSCRGNHLRMRLPSGHYLTYREARLEPDPIRPEWTAITYMGLNQYTRQWTRLRTWGSKLIENGTQALARDIMAESAYRAVFERALPLCLMVHDELIGEPDAKRAGVALTDLLELMRAPVSWAKELPIEAVGWVGTRYRKA